MAFTLDSIGPLGAVLGSVVVWFAALVVIALLVGAIIFFLYRELQFKHKAVLLLTNQESGEVKKTIFLSMRKNIKKGYLRLKKLKLDIDIPGPEYWTSIGKKEGVYFQWDGREMLVPTKASVNSPLSFSPAQYDIIDKMVSMRLKSAERVGNLTHWQKYGHYYIIFGVTFLLMIGVYFMSNEIGGGFKELASALKANLVAVNQAGTEVIQ